MGGAERVEAQEQHNHEHNQLTGTIYLLLCVFSGSQVLYAQAFTDLGSLRRTLSFNSQSVRLDIRRRVMSKSTLVACLPKLERVLAPTVGPAVLC